MAIISNIRKRGQILNLGRLAVDIEDDGYLSNYFVLSEFDPKFSGGKNTFLINGSPNLSINSPIQIEALDSSNNSLYVEVAKSNSISYTEGGALRVAVHIYSITRQGIGKLYIVGTTPTGKKVRWSANIQIYPTLENRSSVVFYKPPTLKINSLVTKAGNSKSSTSSIIKNISGTFKSFAVTPRKGDDYDQFDVSKQNVDYRAILTITAGEINGNLNVASMVDSDLTLIITQLNDVGSVSVTSKNIISEVLNDTTVRLKYPIYVYDSRNRKIIADVTNGTFSATVVDIPYDSTATTSYSQSLAVITYSNIDTFSGNVYRHKLYRKSLISFGDYELISDARITPVDILSDTISTNAYFSSLGNFPRGFNSTNEFVNHYWFSGSTSITTSRDGTKLMDGMSIVNSGEPTYEGYVIVKNDTSGLRNAYYNSYVYTNPIASNVYDSNFISCSANIPYELSFKAIVTKNSDDLTKDASVGFYFTSSQYDKISSDLDFNTQKGIKLGELVLGSGTSSLYQVDNPISFYSQFANDFVGTMVIYTKNCNATVSQIKLKNYTEFSISPSVYVSSIPFSIAEKNQQFKFRSELFDVDSKLVYSNLTTISAFDQGGSSIPSIAPPSSGSITTDATTNLNSITPSGSISMNPITPSGSISIDPITPSGSISMNPITPSGSISMNPITPSGSISIASFTPSGSISMNPITPTGTISITPITPSGSISIASFTPSGSISIASFTPSGSISIASFTPSGKVTISGTDYPLTMDQSSLIGTVSLTSITPSGIISMDPITLSGIISMNPITPSGSISMNPITPSGSISIASFTPSGSISMNPITPTGTISITPITPSGSISMNPITPSGIISITPITPTGTVSINQLSPIGAVTINQLSPIGAVTINQLSFTDGSWNSSLKPLRTPDVYGSSPPDTWLEISGYKVPAYKAT